MEPELRRNRHRKHQGWNRAERLLTDNEPPSEGEPKDRKLTVKPVGLGPDFLQDLNVPPRQAGGDVSLKQRTPIQLIRMQTREIHSYHSCLLFPLFIHVGVIDRIWRRVTGDVFVEEPRTGLCQNHRGHRCRCRSFRTVASRSRAKFSVDPDRCRHHAALHTMTCQDNPRPIGPGTRPPQ